MFNRKNIALALSTLFLAGSISMAADVNSLNENSPKHAVATWEGLADEAETLLNAGDLVLAGELLNESIKSKKTVRNLTLKGDQYAKDNMTSNALYFYQKALVEGITNNKNFDVEPLQWKIMELNPTAHYLEAKGDAYANKRQFKGATKMYIKAMDKALQSADSDLITQIQDKVRRIN